MSPFEGSDKYSALFGQLACATSHNNVEYINHKFLYQKTESLTILLVVRQFRITKLVVRQIIMYQECRH
jgi:hypothetical protein